ncbi:Transposable element Tc3 transposase [Anthophora plagiata]
MTLSRFVLAEGSTILTMDRYTLQQRIHIIQTYYENGRSLINTYRKLRNYFGVNNRPNQSSIQRLVKKFEETGSVVDKPKSGRPKTVRTNENIAAVCESVKNEPTTSISRRSQELGISYGSVWRILHADLHLPAYRIQLTQELKEMDHLQRRNFASWIIEQRATDPLFSTNILFSGEARFTMDGVVSKENCVIWGNENPRVIREKSLCTENVAVWCAFWANGIIGPFFFEDNAGNTVTTRAEHYQSMLSDFLWPELNCIDVSDVYFQQDDVTCDTTRENVQLLRSKFGQRVISCNADINWPPRSCDLTPLDFFLWGYLKSRVYSVKPETRNDLKDNLRVAIREITLATCRKVVENFDSRIDICSRNRGAHLNDILFQI